MTRKAILAALLGLAVGTADAHTILGSGASSCGTWTYWRRMPNETPGSVEVSQWMAGFVSGIGSMSRSDPIEGTDYQGVLAWIDDYCVSHPVDAIYTAGFAFVVAHPGR